MRLGANITTGYLPLGILLCDGWFVCSHHSSVFRAGNIPPPYRRNGSRQFASLIFRRATPSKQRSGWGWLQRSKPEVRERSSWGSNPISARGVKKKNSAIPYGITELFGCGDGIKKGRGLSAILRSDTQNDAVCRRLRASDIDPGGARLTVLLHRDVQSAFFRFCSRAPES